MSYETWKNKIDEFSTIDVRHLQGNFLQEYRREQASFQ